MILSSLYMIEGQSMRMRMSLTQYNFLFVAFSVSTRPAVVLSSLHTRCPETWPWAEHIPGLISTILIFT